MPDPAASETAASKWWLRHDARRHPSHDARRPSRMSAATPSDATTTASSRRTSTASGEVADASTRAVARTMAQYELLVSSQAERKRLASASRSAVKPRSGANKPTPSLEALRRQPSSTAHTPQAADDGAAVAGLFVKQEKRRAAAPRDTTCGATATAAETAAAATPETAGGGELSWEHAVLAAVEDEAAQRAKAPPRCHLCAIVGDGRPSVPRREPAAPRPVSASVSRVHQLKVLVAARGSVRRLRPASADRGVPSRSECGGPVQQHDLIPPAGATSALPPRAATPTLVRRNTGAFMATSVRSSSALGRGLSRTSGSKGSYRGEAPDEGAECLSLGTASDSDAADDAQAALLRDALAEKTAERATKRRRDLISSRPLTDAQQLRRSLDARRVHGRERDVALQRLSQSAQLARRSASATRFWSKAAEFL